MKRPSISERHPRKLALAGLLLVVCSGAHAQCAPASTKVDKFRVEQKGTLVTSILGVIVNGCSVPAGVQLKVIFYDKQGGLLRVEDMWPASTSNIPANSDFPFQVSLERVEGFDKVEVRVIRTKTW